MLQIALGPFLLGLSHDRFGTYVPMLMVNVAFVVVMCVLLLGLGPYRFGVREPPAMPALADASAE